MSLREAFSGSSPALIIITKSNGFTPRPAGEDSEDSEASALPAATQALLEQENLKVIKTVCGSSDHLLLLSRYPATSDCSFVMTKNGTISAIKSDVDLAQLIESPQDFVVEQGTEVSSSHAKCCLSIRTISGDVIKGTFSADQSLLDIKRWLHKAKGISFEFEQDEVASRYTTIGHFKPSRFAFFSPATRTTFTESQELMRLKDLDLCPRSALLLRPDFDVLAMKAARAAEKESPLRSFWLKSKTLLQALYQFFDYGVDEAKLDFQDMVEEIEKEENFGQSMFGAFAAPVLTGTSVAPTTAVVDMDIATDAEAADLASKSQLITPKDSAAQVYGEEVNFKL